MSVFFTESFGRYGKPGIASAALLTALTAGADTWTTSGGTGNGISLSLVAGLNSLSNQYGLRSTSGDSGGGSVCGAVKTLAASSARTIGGIRGKFISTTNAAAAPWFITFLYNGVAQFSITLNLTTLQFSIRTGSRTGTALATSSSAASSGVAFHLEWDVTVGASGAYAVYLDGVATPILTGTGNTRGDAANNLYNGFQFGATSDSFNKQSIGEFDDLYLADTTGTVLNAVTLQTPMIEESWPTADSSVVSTNRATLLGDDAFLVATTNAPGANQLFLRKFTAAVNKTLNSVSCLPRATSAGAKFKAVLYPDSAGTPNAQTLTATGAEVVGATSGTVLTSTFGSPPSLTAGTTYWIGFITDTSVVLQQIDAGTTGVKAANTYTSGAPGTCPTVTTGQVNWEIYGNCTGSAVAWESESRNPSSGLLSYNGKTASGDEDLLTFPALASSSSIYCVAVKGYLAKSDAGARTISLRAKSSGTDGGGSTTGQSPSTSFGWMASYFENDPVTGVAWLVAAVTAATYGTKIDS